MAEKRGQYQYHDDGTTSQLVSGDVSIEESKAQLPFDHQATLTNTAQTHTSAAVAPSASNTQATWQQVPEGMTEFIQNLTMDVGHTNVVMAIFWSEDGTNTNGRTLNTVPAVNSTAKTSSQWLPIGGVWYKAEIQNGDTVPKTCSANIKFRP